MASSRWQQGPDYLGKPIYQWPISRDFSTHKDDYVPSNELLKQFSCLIQMTETSISVGVEKFNGQIFTNSSKELLRLIQNLLVWRYKAHFCNSSASTVLQYAKRLWFLSAMSDTNVALKSCRLRELDIREENCYESHSGQSIIWDKEGLWGGYSTSHKGIY